MTFEIDLWEEQEVQDIMDNVKAILKKELITMDYTAEGNSFRKQFACPLPELLEACQEFLVHVKLSKGNASSTVPYFCN